MLRPEYETVKDLSNEGSIASMLSEMWDVEVEKLKRFAPADVAFVSNGEIEAFAEIKVRKNTKLHYPTYMISLHKLEELARLHDFSGKRCLLIVSWLDSLGWWKIPSGIGSNLRIEMGGTFRRGDPQDREPVVHIPIDEFHDVKPLRLNRRSPD